MSKRGISRLINYLQPGDATGKDIKNFQNQLTEIIEDSKFSVTIESIKRWGELVGDRNKIHTSKGAAIKAGLKDTPVHGTYLAAQCEQYVSKNLRFFSNLVGEQLVYSGQSIKFSSPLLPDVEARWKLGNIETFENGFDLGLFLIDKNGKSPFSGVSKIRHKRKDYSRGEGVFAEGKFVTERRNEIDVNLEQDRDDLGTFYELLDTNKRNFTPITLPCALPVSALVDFALDESDVFLGIYRSMSFDFHDYPGLGSFKSVVRMPEAPVDKRRLGTEYNFETICLQEGTYVLSGKIKCLTDQGFKI